MVVWVKGVVYQKPELYGKTHDPAISATAQNQWEDDQGRYWQHENTMSNTLPSAKQLNGNLSQPASGDTHGVCQNAPKKLVTQNIQLVWHRKKQSAVCVL